MTRHGAGPALCVTVVSANEETLDGLEAYLRQANLAVHATRELEAKLGQKCDAIVFFPDEFATEDVIRVMARVRRERPAVRIVVVTHHGRRFADAFDSEDGSPLTIIPKPAWGWTILDAIRGAQE